MNISNNENNPNNIINIIKAIAKAKREMTKPPKDGVNPHFKSRYTTLDALMTSLDPVLAANGLVMTPRLVNGEGTVGCAIDLYHESGEYLKADAFFLPAQGTAQGHGSAATYVQRYAISAFWCIAAEEDDDGNIATGTKTKKVQEPKSANSQCQRAVEAVADMYKKLELPFNKDDLECLSIDKLRNLYINLEKMREAS